MQLYRLGAAALAVVALACRDDRAEAAVDSALLPLDSTVAVAGGDTAVGERGPRRDSAAGATANASPDGKALGAFIAASEHEIQHGRVATEKGTSQAVRDLGRSISRDHDDFVQRARALGRAIDLFKVGAERRTHGRTGILIYLSMREHRAEIVADEAIASKVSPETWGEAMAAMLVEIKAGRCAEGMIAAVERVGAVLAEHFPRAEDDQNELPDRLIEL